MSIGFFLFSENYSSAFRENFCKLYMGNYNKAAETRLSNWFMTGIAFYLPDIISYRQPVFKKNKITLTAP